MKDGIRAHLIMLIMATSILCGCAQMDQGISGQIFSYGVGMAMDCSQFTDKEDIEHCHSLNQSRMEPMKGKTVIRVKNLKNGQVQMVRTDEQGTFKMGLPVGEYELCIGSNCSPSLAVKEGEYTPYDFVFLRQ